MIYALTFLPVIVWVIFLAYASLKIHWHSLPVEVRIVGALVVLFGFLLDVVMNWTLGLALGVTKDFTLSQKCKRLAKLGGWRAAVARYLCQNWLNVFDQEHC